MNKLSVLMLWFPFPAFAFCFDEAGNHYNVSPDLLRAIATVESNLNPNAINENKNNVGEVVSRDYGLMQINSIWFDKLSDFNVNDQNVYDPCLTCH
ncbi:Lytic transglycosylase PilT (fragment) [Vibrio tapetis subsp. tapetis]|uniref:Lytic transglycosylase PilT n=1 Tax=Vibrio tapetis subsp. tapetis TaxID=1671868 RepID=A0A2N8ZI14_9VIBR